MKYNDKEIIEEYLKGKSTKEIANELSTYNTTIRRILLRNGVKVRNCSEANSKINLNLWKDYSETRDYWLGFIIADGNVSTEGNRINITVAEKDQDHLQKYATWLGINMQCYVHKRFKKLQYVASFKNKAVKNILVNLGIKPNKSLTLELLMPFNRHIVRGILDGDGTVKYCNGEKRIGVQIFSGSSTFIYQLAEYISDQGINYSSITRSSSVYCLNFYLQKEIYKLYDFLYTDANIFLERKRDRFLATTYWEQFVKNTLNSGKAASPTLSETSHEGRAETIIGAPRTGEGIVQPE